MPMAIHNVWTMVAVGILAVFAIKGVCDYAGNYLVNYVGLSAVTDLSQDVFDRVVHHERSGEDPGGHVQYPGGPIAPELHSSVFGRCGFPNRLETGARQPDCAAVCAGSYHEAGPAHPPDQP